MVVAQIDVAELPALATKKQVAEWAGTTSRNIELQVAAGAFPKPIYVGVRSPRFRRSDLIAWLEGQRQNIADHSEA